MPAPAVRGKLIFPFVVELAQLDTAETAKDPDGSGELTSGYHEHFREPVKVATDPAADQLGESARAETTLQFQAQIEPNMMERLEAFMAGVQPESRFAVVAHFAELEKAGLVDSDGNPKIRPNDRLVRILQTNGTLVQKMPQDPALYVHEVQSRGFGPGGARNLLLIDFEEREQSPRGGG